MSSNKTDEAMLQSAPFRNEGESVITLFTSGSAVASRIFYWDEGKQGFSNVWESD